jgi:hypothetical protein
MDVKPLEEIQNNGVVRKRLAKAAARDCFRHTKLENCHASVFPLSKARVRYWRRAFPLA